MCRIPGLGLEHRITKRYGKSVQQIYWSDACRVCYRSGLLFNIPGILDILCELTRKPSSITVVSVDNDYEVLQHYVEVTLAKVKPQKMFAFRFMQPALSATIIENSTVQKDSR